MVLTGSYIGHAWLSLCQVCSKARLNDATSYLLERSGDAMGAFKLILEVSRFVIFHKRERERERERENEGRYIYSLICWCRLSLLRWRLSVKGTTKRRQLMILSWQRRWRKLREYYRHCCSSVRETLVGWTKKQDRWVKHFLLPCGV